MYIGLGVPDVGKRLRAHLASDKGTQLKIQAHLMTQQIRVWTMDRASKIRMGEVEFTADFRNRYELELFEKAAIAFAHMQLSPVWQITNK